MSFNLDISDDASATIDGLERSDEKKWKKVVKALQFLEQDPKYPSLHSKKFKGMEGQGPNGEDYWESYVENKTPAAWRILWYYDKYEKDLIGVVWLGQHQ